MDRHLPPKSSDTSAEPSARPNATSVAPTAAQMLAAARLPVRSRLRDAGLRPTRQRVALAEILYSRGHRHVSAEDLHAEAVMADVPVSLATVYNTLHQFTEAGLLRELAVDGSKSYFDTNVHDHHHFFVEGENAMMDVPASAIGINALPEPPEGYEIARVDVLVRIKRKGA